MSVIRPLTPRQERHVCPDCAAPEGLFIDQDRKLSCKLCGWQDETADDHALTTDTTPETDQDIRDIRDFKVTYGVSNRSTLSTWGSAAYDSALAHIKRKEWDQAITSLQRAIDTDRDFVEAHLWLGRLLTDEKQQRDHLSYVIGYMPNSAEALLELMYLNGQVSLSQLEHALNSGDEIEIHEAVAPVASETVILSCPVCGGHMTTHPLTGHVECAFCGHVEEEEQTGKSTVGTSLTHALLQQRSQGVKWVVGERILHCRNCGAERTITDGKMGSHCLYCGSNHIIEQDALNSFRQPEGIIPFSIPQEQAEQAIQDKLFGKWERFKGMIVNNKVKQSIFTGTYLPFWVFDIILDVNLSFRLIDDSAVRYGASATRKEQHADSFNNFVFPGVISPAPRLIEKVDNYDFTQVKPYDPSALARYPAEIYQIDFDKASLEVRGRARRLLNRKYQSRAYARNNEELTNLWTTIRNMSFRLLLLPMWVATLTEEDGDVRIGLVNGQTGQAVLGRARQPDHFSSTPK